MFPVSSVGSLGDCHLLSFESIPVVGFLAAAGDSDEAVLERSDGGAHAVPAGNFLVGRIAPGVVARKSGSWGVDR